MPLSKLQFRPGVNREMTSYANEGGWFDCDMVRFRDGMPEKIGGWTKLGSNSFLGACRALHSWRTVNLNNYLGVGTNIKYYIEEGEGYFDITPIRSITPVSRNVAVSIYGASATGEVGEVSTPMANVSVTLTGVTAFSQINYVDAQSEGGDIVYLTGTSATGEVGGGTFINTLPVEVTGLEATTAVGGVNVVTTAVDFDSEIIFSATDGSSTISVNDIEHGAVTGDFVTFTDAIGLGGNITAEILNQEYQIALVVDEDNYTIVARTVASVSSITVDGTYTPSPVVANASDTGEGGGSTIGAYQINVGVDTSISGNGWGAGAWGRGTWGSGADINAEADTLRVWSHDNFGEDLIFNVSNGPVYYWDASATNPKTKRGVPLSSLAGASNVPTVATQVMVSDRDRHVIAFGANPLGSSVQDPLLIRFSDQQNVAEWTPTTTNTAGDLTVGVGSKIVCAVETRQQTLVFTDASLHGMQFLGPPFTFGLNLLSDNISIAGINATASAQDRVFWMGRNEFFVFDGTVRKLPCSVKDYVFSDFNESQSDKVYCSTNTSFSEVWWFYPSSSSQNVDRYVSYNYDLNLWTYGTLSRTAWTDVGIIQNPIAAGTDGYLYYHEDGFDDGSTNPASALTAYIESSQVDLGDGNEFSFVSRLIPDITFRDSTAASPTAIFTLKARNFPGGQYLQEDDSSVIKTASVPVEQFTQQNFVRLRGRSIALRVESDTTGVGWRLGAPRIDVRQDGRR
jgi:hypothetical protein